MPQAHPARQPNHKKIAVIPGDGIGKEVTTEAVRILEIVAASGGKKLELVNFDWGADRFLREGTTLPDDAPDMFRKEFDSYSLARWATHACLRTSMPPTFCSASDSSSTST